MCWYTISGSLGRSLENQICKCMKVGNDQIEVFHLQLADDRIEFMNEDMNMEVMGVKIRRATFDSEICDSPVLLSVRGT